MPAYKLLAIDDSSSSWEDIASFLGERGMEVRIAGTSNEGLQSLTEQRYDLVLLDEAMQSDNYLEVIRLIKSTLTVPVFVISHRDEPRAKVTSIELGADDFLIRPLDVDELAARIRSKLQLIHDVKAETRERLINEDPRGLRFGDWELDFHRHELRVRGGEKLSLTTGELEILMVLARSAGRVVSRETLFTKTRGRDSGNFDRAVDVQISRIRQKMNDDGYTIKTVRGVGYMLDIQTQPFYD